MMTLIKQQIFGYRTRSVPALDIGWLARGKGRTEPSPCQACLHGSIATMATWRRRLLKALVKLLDLPFGHGTVKEWRWQWNAARPS